MRWAPLVTSLLLGLAAGMIAYYWWPMWILLGIVWFTLLVIVILTRPRKRKRH